MFDIFQNTTRPAQNLFFKKNDLYDPRLGEIVTSEIENYELAEVVILGCPQDEGVARNGSRIGAARAPEAIRRQFYKLTPFGISSKIFDLGDTKILNALEETHDLHTKIIEQILRDEKQIIVLGGGNDISFADGNSMSNVFGKENWTALNVDAHFDVRNDSLRNSGTPYRQLLDGNFINAANFYEIGFQTHAASPIYYDYLKELNVNLISIEELHKSIADLQKEIAQSNAIFWGFDVDVVRSSDAPGVSASNPFGLIAEEFCSLVNFAGSLAQTKIVEFTEVNPNFDIDNRTAKLVAVAMHNFLQTKIKKPTE